ncbi:MAG: DUF4134 domain-containing protein [Muribaculum sp.]|nr:DUF4134 domain-containing protein [Muribaculum sp.]
MRKIKIESGLISIKKAIKGLSQRVLTMLVMTFFCSLSMFAADAGSKAFGDIAADIAAYLPQVQKVVYAIAAIIALVGAFNIYHKMTNGDQDVKKTIMLVIGGCVALLALSSALPAMFSTGAA